MCPNDVIVLLSFGNCFDNFRQERESFMIFLWLSDFIAPGPIREQYFVYLKCIDNRLVLQSVFIF